MELPQAKGNEWYRCCLVQGALSLLLRNGGKIDFPEIIPKSLQTEGEEVADTVALHEAKDPEGQRRYPTCGGKKKHRLYSETQKNAEHEEMAHSTEQNKKLQRCQSNLEI